MLDEIYKTLKGSMAKCVENFSASLAASEQAEQT